MLENITKRRDRCNKSFHDSINIVTSIFQNSPTLSGDEYGMVQGNDTIANSSMTYLGGFFDAAEEGFNAVLQCLHTEYYKHILTATFQENQTHGIVQQDLCVVFHHKIPRMIQHPIYSCAFLYLTQS
jgi:hypothetical protein